MVSPTAAAKLASRASSTEVPFVLSEEADLFRASVRAFARGQLAPGYLERARSDEFPTEAYGAVIAHGFGALNAPESLGGQEVDVVSLGIALEELAWADFNLAELVFLNALMVELLQGHELFDTVVADIAAGRRRMALGLTEPGAGSDANALTTRAIPDGDGWRLFGEKTSISAAPHAHSAIVFAREPGVGVSAFLVDLDDTVHRQRFDDPGNRPVGRGSLIFDGTPVPPENLLGARGRGFQQVMGAFDLSRPLLGLMAVGTAQHALEMTVDYVRTREAFGRPLAHNQGVSFPLAEHDTSLELTRTLGYRALGLRLAGRPHTREAAMLKWWGPVTGVRVISDCILLHGHIGWSNEMPLQQMCHDVGGMQIGDGTAQIQKLVIARALLGRDMVP
jgi:cyclohexanecarboxyl-CoA dehydrogenase